MIVRARTEIDEELIIRLLEGQEYKFQAASECYFSNSGSASLRFFLKLQGSGKRVGVQVYTCPTVLEAITAEGCIPVFLDINPEYYTSTIDYVKDTIDKMDILLLTHLFGIPNPDYLEIKELCREHNVVLVSEFMFINLRG